jgi:hypothetical protein
MASFVFMNSCPLRAFQRNPKAIGIQKSALILALTTGGLFVIFFRAAPADSSASDGHPLIPYHLS